MPRARLTVTLPEGSWIRDVSEEYPKAGFRVLSVMPTEEGGVGVLEVRARNLPAVVEAMDDQPDLRELELLQVGDGRALVQFEAERPQLLGAIQRSGAPLEFPVSVADGDARLELTLSRDRLSELGDQLRAAGMTFDLAYVREAEVDGEAVLTERQRDLLGTAIEAGYYDVPRTCTLTELAEQLGIAKSTASERLHRAESAVVKAVVGTD